MLLFAFLRVFVFVVSVQSQAIDPDTIDFSNIKIWKDLRSCLQSVFNYYPIQWEIGCGTNACLCRPDILGLAIVDAAALAMSRCSDIQDQSSATSIVIAYCSTRGYTSIVYPSVVSTTGASTVTVTAAAHTFTVPTTVTVFATVTQTIRVSGASRAFHLSYDAVGIASILLDLLILGFARNLV